MVSVEYNSLEVIYFPEISVDRFKTFLRLDVPPVSVAFSIKIFECSSDQEEATPTSLRAFINPSIVIVLSTLIVRFSPRISKIAVPVPVKPKLPSVVDLVASIVFVTVCLKARDFAEDDATEVWFAEIASAPYKHLRRFVPFLYLASVSLIVPFAIKAKTSASDSVLNEPPVIVKTPVSSSKEVLMPKLPISAIKSAIVCPE